MQVSGEVTYNGRTFKEFRPLRTASYIEQTDSGLMAEMTVRETLDFSARCQGVSIKKGELLNTNEEKERHITACCGKQNIEVLLFAHCTAAPHCVRYSDAELLEEVVRQEAERSVEVDRLVAEFMAAEVQQGRPSSISTEFLVSMLGLGICSNTQVGNALRPSCSPGQKKRVTTGTATSTS